tara:strand:+ start:1157 stop:1342 length:186 start_codon:yes stop_codon:yes gene_type:complete
MKKILSTIVLSSLFVLAIAPPVEAHTVRSRKQCEQFARQYLKMSCDKAIELGLIVLIPIGM